MDPDREPAPPAGGFGQTPHSASFGHQIGPGPNRSSAVMVVSVLVLVGCTFSSFMAWGWWKWHKATVLAEPHATVGAIARNAVNAYEQNGAICPNAAPVPAHIETVRGVRYQSSERDWKDDPGWSCLGFTIDRTQGYQYRYEQSADGFVVTAEGDLDGDDVDSTYRVIAHYRKSANSPRPVLQVEPAIAETNPGE